MKHLPATASTAGTELDLEQRTRLVERIAASELFRKSPRLRDFFLYAADCTLHNRLSDVREQIIAARVFGRRPEFNGGQDSIVRAEARNLRKRLETYFETEGIDEPIVIAMPKGGYALAFEPRAMASGKTSDISSDSEPVSARPSLEVVHPVFPLQSPDHGGGKLSRQRGSIAAVLGLIAVCTFVLAFYWRSASANVRNMGQDPKPGFPFSALLADGKDSFIITSDTGFLQISSLAHRRITLDEYMARSYPAVPKTDPPDLIKNWNLYEFTDGREMALAGMIIRKYAHYAEHIELHSGHQIEIGDLKDHASIIIGSPISNPWAQVYEDRLNFATDLATDGRIIFRNKSARARESAQYPNEDDIQHHRTYARLVFFPGLADASASLLIAGTTAQATQGAGELLVDKNRLGTVLHSVGMDSSSQPRFFEVLVRMDNFVGGAILPEVVACRTREAED